MSESDEINIKKEINDISKTISSILKKIEQEREKFQPAVTEDDPPESLSISAKNDRKDKPLPPGIETADEPPEI